MPTREQLEFGFREAHKAGNKEHAQRFATALRELEAEPIAKAPSGLDKWKQAQEKYRSGEYKSPLSPRGDVVEVQDLFPKVASGKFGSDSPIVWDKERTPQLSAIEQSWPFAVTDEDRKKILDRHIPGVTYSETEDGIVADIPGVGVGFLNAKGISDTDYTSLIGQSPLYMGAQAAVSSLIKGPLKATGIAGSSASIGTDIARGKERDWDEDAWNQLKNVYNEDVNLVRATQIGLAGPAIQKAGGVLLTAIGSKLGGNIWGTNGRITPEAKRIADELGVSEKEVYIAAREANIIPDEQAVERLGFAKAMQEMGTTRDFTAAGRELQSKLIQMSKADKASVRAAYTVAKDNNIAIKPEAGERIYKDLMKSVAQYEKEFIPSTIKLIESSLGSKVGLDKQTATQALRGEVQRKTYGLDELFSLRRRLGKAAHKSTDDTESSAMGVAKAKIDSILDDFGEDILLNSTPEAIQAWRTAISKNAEYFSKFKSKDLVGTILKREFVDGQNRLKHPPEAVSNLIFNASDSKLFAASGLSRDLLKVKNMLGPNSPEWQAVKTESFMRVFRNSMPGKIIPESPAEFLTMWKPDKFFQSWSKMKQNNPDVIKVLYNDTEMKLMENMAKLARLSSTKEGAASKQAATVADDIQKTMSRVAYVGGVTQGGYGVGIAASSSVKLFYALMKNLRGSKQMARDVPSAITRNKLPTSQPASLFPGVSEE